MSECRAKHTTPQTIPDADWRCPKCGATCDPPRASDHAFVVEYTAEASDPNCALLHVDDELRCGCGYATSGRAFAAVYRRRASLVTCPRCKGSGCVASKGGEEAGRGEASR